MLIDSASFAVLGCVVLAIRTGTSPDLPPPPATWRSDLTAGLRLVAADRRLRAMTSITLTGDLMFAGITALMTVVLRHDGASRAAVGYCFAWRPLAVS
jgi:hypothetical protein